jgi:hypothetical protein
VTDSKLPIGQDDTHERHRRTVDEAKKDIGAATRAQIANKASVTLSELNDQRARGLSHYDDAGVLLTVDQALAHVLAGHVVHAKVPPEEKEIRVTKGPIIEEKA